MDIDYLLFLQNIRENYVPFLSPIMEAVSLFSISFVLLIPMYIYWCRDKKEGRYILTTWSTTLALNSVIKLTACVYRPWIREPNVMPAGDAVKTATGYSFPSGHSCYAATMYGSTAYICYKDKKKILAGILIFAAMLTGFSRNFLGVHTPQDVVVGLAEGVIMIFVMAKIYDHLDEHPEDMGKYVAIGILLAILAQIYIMVKPYPMTYVDGVLLVDPVKMRYDSVQDIGTMVAVLTAVYVDHKWLQYEAVPMKGLSLAIAIACGAVFAVGGFSFRSACIKNIGPSAGRLIYSFAFAYYVMLLVPFLLKWSAAKMAEKEKAGEA